MFFINNIIAIACEKSSILSKKASPPYMNLTAYPFCLKMLPVENLFLLSSRFTTLSPAVGGKHTASDLLRFYFLIL
jgi:hypothetical protein